MKAETVKDLETQLHRMTWLLDHLLPSPDEVTRVATDLASRADPLDDAEARKRLTVTVVPLKFCAREAEAVLVGSGLGLVDAEYFRAEVAERGVLIRWDQVDPDIYAQEAASLGICIGPHAREEGSAP